VDLVKRFDVVLVDLDPTRGSEIPKTRPCAVVSPDEMNRSLRTLIVAPMTRGGRRYPTRVPCAFDGVDGFVALDQLRTVDRDRIVRRAGALEPSAQREVLDVLGRLFAP
jgi:mRNA interferase MazF